ncbi:MAG: DNA repair protein RecN [Flavobacteriales bacterium]|jgi:DNA repair protein RecN (Recombination protein N)
MLTTLFIQNYALIDELSLDVSKGFTAITGETGSGKSILLGAFGLLLGERADLKSIRRSDAKCVVEASFDLSEYDLQSFFDEHDLDFDSITVIRREIAPGGKSRAFVNDTPVQLNTLKLLGAQLVDIHSQHENSLLGERAFQFDVLDAFANTDSSLKSYREVFEKWNRLRAERDELTSQLSQWQQEQDYVQFQLQELEKAGLEQLNQDELESELNTLQHADHIRQSLHGAGELLDASEHSVLSRLASAKSLLGKVSIHSTALTEYHSRLDSSIIELRELRRDLESFAAGVNSDEKRAEQIGERLSLLYQLQKKHRVQTTDELVAIMQQLQSRAFSSEELENRIQACEQEIEKCVSQLEEFSIALDKARSKGAKLAEKEMRAYFSQLSMEHAEVNFMVERKDEFDFWGRNQISFLFKANKGGQFLPIQKVASGGEIARVMLAIKASISKHKRLPVLILDEIDQGVSGEVGLKIGSILKEMSGTMQLISITHLPQIAGKAEQHWKVSKSVKGESTTTHVTLLAEEQRINELAEMLSGKKLSAASLANARELLA